MRNASRRPRKPSLLTIVLISCAFVLPVEAAGVQMGLISTVETTESTASFSDSAYGEGDYGLGSNISEPTTAPTTLPPAQAPATGVTTSTTFPTSTALAGPTTTTTAPITQESSETAQPVSDAPDAPQKRSPSVAKWILNPLGAVVDRFEDRLPRWFNDFLAEPVSTAGWLWPPFAIGGAVWLYLRHQHRIDAHEEKLTASPLHNDDTVTFLEKDQLD
jgi:hypothetical protein